MSFVWGGSQGGCISITPACKVERSLSNVLALCMEVCPLFQQELHDEVLPVGGGPVEGCPAVLISRRIEHARVGLEQP